MWFDKLQVDIPVTCHLFELLIPSEPNNPLFFNNNKHYQTLFSRNKKVIYFTKNLEYTE